MQRFLPSSGKWRTPMQSQHSQSACKSLSVANAIQMCAVGEVCAEAKNKSMADHSRRIARGWAVYWSGVRNRLGYVKVTHTHACDRLERNRHPFASAVGPVKPEYNKALCCHTSLFISSNNVWKVTKQTKTFVIMLFFLLLKTKKRYFVECG